MTSSTLSRVYRNNTNVPFSKLWIRVLAVSGALIVIGVLALFVRGLNLGLEFEGGASWQLPANGVTVSDARDALDPLGLASARIQTGDDLLRVRAKLDAEGAKASEVTDMLLALTGSDRAELSFESAGASWGNEVTNSAVRALIVFFIVIAGYITIRLRWQMAVGALVGVVHDILITVGFYAVFQFDVTPATVIAFLTIMGYSLYDTMIVFDKVRDNEHRVAYASLSETEIMDLSLNQVMMRSVNTSVTSVIPILAVLLVGSVALGAVTLNEFALALLIGIILGAFSSMFVAAPIAVWLGDGRHRGEGTAGTYSVAERRRQGIPTGAVRPVTTPGETTIPPRPRKQKRR